MRGNPFVVAVVATYRRSSQLRRLLEGLGKQGCLPRAVVVADNGLEAAVKNLLEEERAAPGDFKRLYIPMPENRGCGPGLAVAMEEAEKRYGAEVTHFWILDDDVVLAPEVLQQLLDVMEKTNAGCVAPLLSDPEGNLWAFPEPRDRELRTLIRKIRTIPEAREVLGLQPLDFCWATGACLLVSAEAVRRNGLPRTDFWMLGEDLEFSMRIASRSRGVFTSQVEVPHLPPEMKTKEDAFRWGYLKFCALLQNLTYLSFHASESGHLGRYLPGNYRRFFKDYGFKRTVVRDAFSCFWSGSVLGQPAGGESGKKLRNRMENGSFRQG